VRAVLDANVVVRAVLDQGEEAATWVGRLEDADFVAAVPDLLFPEVGQALIGYVKRGRMNLSGAQEQLDFVCELPFNVFPTSQLVVSAVAVAEARKLSVYDACYAVLAEVEQAVLVTADRRLAAAVTRAELV
jgi:predicted nucleic acid-binding protein